MTMIKHTHRKTQNGYDKTYSLLFWTKFYERQVFSHAYDTSHYHTVSLYIYGGGLVAKSCPTLVTPWTVTWQAPLSMGFSRQEYWSGLPFPSPRDLPNPEIEPRSPALQADSLPIELQGKPYIYMYMYINIHIYIYIYIYINCIWKVNLLSILCKHIFEKYFKFTAIFSKKLSCRPLTSIIFMKSHKI